MSFSTMVPSPSPSFFSTVLSFSIVVVVLLHGEKLANVLPNIPNAPSAPLAGVAKMDVHGAAPYSSLSASSVLNARSGQPVSFP